MITTTDSWTRLFASMALDKYATSPCVCLAASHSIYVVRVSFYKRFVVVVRRLHDVVVVRRLHDVVVVRRLHDVVVVRRLHDVVVVRRLHDVRVASEGDSIHGGHAAHPRLWTDGLPTRSVASNVSEGSV